MTLALATLAVAIEPATAAPALPHGCAAIFPGVPFLSADEARGLDLVASHAAPELAEVVRRLLGADLLAIARRDRFVSVAALEGLLRTHEDAAPGRPALFGCDRAIADGDEVGRLSGGPGCGPATRALGQRIWAVLVLALHLEVLASGAAHLADPPPRPRSVVLHGWRLTIGHALAEVLAAVPPARETAAGAVDLGAEALCGHIARLNGELLCLAARHAMRFRRAIGRDLTWVEGRSVREALHRRYHEDVLLKGARHPQFRAALTAVATGAHASAPSQR